MRPPVRFWAGHLSTPSAASQVLGGAGAVTLLLMVPKAGEATPGLGSGPGAGGPGWCPPHPRSLPLPGGATLRPSVSQALLRFPEPATPDGAHRHGFVLTAGESSAVKKKKVKLLIEEIWAFGSIEVP